jgi:hypothetical protein
MPEVTATHEADEPAHDADTICGLQRSFPKDLPGRASDER